MSEEDKLPFLSRWSRRKIEAKEEAPALVQPEDALPQGEAELAAAPAPGSAATDAPPKPLPTIDSLQGVASEYGEFFKPGVDETLKRAALKKLFSDPHFSFASMDKLDIYIDDYSIEDPIPEAMLRMMNQSKSLFLFDEKKETGDEAGAADAAPGPASEEPAVPTALAAAEDAGAPVTDDAQSPVPASPQPKKLEPPTAG